MTINRNAAPPCRAILRAEQIRGALAARQILPGKRLRFG
jgi:hypothetical protein